MEPADAEKRVGTTLCNKWTLERTLGVGGMAAVYVAVHKIGRRDAIKILHPEIAKSTELRTRFEMEAHVANRFKHPGAVEVRDIDKTEDGAPFLVMELLEGESLGERAKRLNGIETNEMMRLVDELLDVLAAAHEQGIVHRDIKLDNLFVQTDGKLKVLDFGIARLRDGAAAFNMQTRLGATLGTAPYMSPEQVTGRDVDGRSDIFAVGATMFRLIARRRIHEGATEADILAKMATEPAPALASVAPKAPRGICQIVDRALQFHRDMRYPDALTMQGDVRAVREGKEPPFAKRMAQAVAAAAPGAAAFADAPTAAPTAMGSEPTRAPGARNAPGPTVAAIPAAALAGAATPRSAHSVPTAVAPPAASSEPTRAPTGASQAAAARDVTRAAADVAPKSAGPGSGFAAAVAEPPPSISVRAIVPAAAAPRAVPAPPNSVEEPVFVPRRPPPQEGFLPESLRQHKSLILFGSAFVVLGIVLTVVFAGSHGKASGPVIPAPPQTPPAAAAPVEPEPDQPQEPTRRRPNRPENPLGNAQGNSENPPNQGQGQNNQGDKGQKGGKDKGGGHGKGHKK